MPRVNAAGKRTFVKFHWKPKLGVQSTLWDKAVKIAGAAPGFHRRDLFEAIARGQFPEWELGIDFTNDPLLQGRLFSYLDTQKSRLGTANFHQTPVNAPQCPFANFQRDGQMQMLRPKGRAIYEPNSLAQAGEDPGPRECPVTGFTSFAGRSAADEQGDKLRLRPASFADHYSQARLFFRSLAGPEQAHLASAIVFELSKVTLDHVRQRMLANLVNVAPELAQRVADGLSVPLPKASASAAPVQDLPPSAALRLIDDPRQRDTLEGRAVGILFAEGSDAGAIAALTHAITAAGGRPVTIAREVGGIKLSDGSLLKADGQLAGTPSVMVDAIAVVLSKQGCDELINEAATIQFVMDAFGHLKATGHTPGGKTAPRQGGGAAGCRGGGGGPDLHQSGRQTLLAARTQGAQAGLS